MTSAPPAPSAGRGEWAHPARGAAGAAGGAENEDPGAEGGAGEPVPFDARSAEDEKRDPVAPIGVGVGAGLLALGGTILIGRRREW